MNKIQLALNEFQKKSIVNSLSCYDIVNILLEPSSNSTSLDYTMFVRYRGILLPVYIYYTSGNIESFIDDANVEMEHKMYLIDSNLDYQRPFSDSEIMYVCRFIANAAFNLAEFCNVYVLCDNLITEGEITGLRGEIPYILRQNSFDVFKSYTDVLKRLNIDLIDISKRVSGYTNKALL